MKKQIQALMVAAAAVTVLGVSTTAQAAPLSSGPVVSQQKAAPGGVLGWDGVK